MPHSLKPTAPTTSVPHADPHLAQSGGCRERNRCSYIPVHREVNRHVVLAHILPEDLGFCPMSKRIDFDFPAVLEIRFHNSDLGPRSRLVSTQSGTHASKSANRRASGRAFFGPHSTRLVTLRIRRRVNPVLTYERLNVGGSGT